MSLFCAPPQTVVTLENGKLVQKQSWDGKETNIEREITDGKLIAVSNLVVTFKCIKVNYAVVCKTTSSVVRILAWF